MISEPRYNHIDVKITYACNFKCEYCYQTDGFGNRQRGMLSEKNVENLLGFLNRLDNRFRVTLAGGEPFVYPHLEKLVSGLTERKCQIMVITNFSAPMEKIRRFVDICGNCMREFSISIHLSQWKDMLEFYDKLGSFLEIIHERKLPVHVSSTCVVTDENFSEVQTLIAEMNRRFESVPLKLHRVYYDGLYHIYSREAEALLEAHNVDVPINRVNAQDYKGTSCWTGCRFFYVESDGTVYRCYTRQEDDEDWILGNLQAVDEIRVADTFTPCKTADNGRCVCYEHFENVGFICGSRGKSE